MTASVRHIVILPHIILLYVVSAHQYFPKGIDTHFLTFLPIKHTLMLQNVRYCVRVLTDISLTVKAATLIFISWRYSAILSAKQGKSGSIRINELFRPRKRACISRKS